MATGTLAAHKSNTSGTFNVYTVPASTTTEATVSVVNHSGVSATVVLYVSPTNSPTDIHTIQVDTLNTANYGYERVPLILKAGEVVSYSTTTSGVDVVVSGVEYVSASNEIKVQQLITTNTETVIYDNSVAKAGTVNICASIISNLIADECFIEMYVSASDATNGYKILQQKLQRTGVTGIEKAGLPISSTDKIILVTTNIVGSVSTRVAGYTKG
jgi:hypothetical protein